MAAEARAEEARQAEAHADRLRTALENAALASGDDSDESEAERLDVDGGAGLPTATGAAPNAFAGLLDSDQESDGSGGSDKEGSAIEPLRPAAPAPGGSASTASRCAHAARGKRGRREAAERRKQAAAELGGNLHVQPVTSSPVLGAGSSSAPVSGDVPPGQDGAALLLKAPPPKPPPWPKMALAAVVAGSRIEPAEGVPLGWVKGYIAAVYFGTSAERAAAGVPAWADEEAAEAGAGPAVGVVELDMAQVQRGTVTRGTAAQGGAGTESRPPPLPLGASAAADPAATRPWNTGGAFRGKFEAAIGVRGADARLSLALAAAVADGHVLPPQKQNRFRPSEGAVAAAAAAGGGQGGAGADMGGAGDGQSGAGHGGGGKTAGAAGGGGGAAAARLSEEERAALRRQYKAQLGERAARREGFA